MKFPSLESIAERWTVAHTIAVFAWIVVLILGLQLFWRHVSGSYPATSKLKIYAGENLTFMYPENWQVHNCVADKPFIELPGAIKADYKGKQAYSFMIEGSSSYRCIEGRPERFDIYAETVQATENPCSQDLSTKGERLKNGLFLQLHEHNGKVTSIKVKQNNCFAPADVYIMSFAFADPKPDGGIATETPAVPTKDVLASQQYRDIRALAESMRY